jgi:hypothetical protein
MQFESQATAIRAFHTGVFPGLLQTRDYADTVIGSMPDEMPDETRKTRLEVRMRRQDQVLGAEDPPRLLIILDEFVPRRTIGHAAVVADQIRATVEATKQPNILLRVLPRESPAFTHYGTFTIFDFGEDENAVLYRELGTTDAVIQDSTVVQLHRVRFEQMWELCLSSNASASRLEADYYELRASLHRNDPEPTQK